MYVSVERIPLTIRFKEKIEFLTPDSIPFIIKFSCFVKTVGLKKDVNRLFECVCVRFI